MKPTRKWIAAAVTGVAAILAQFIESGQFDVVERGMVATLLVALASSYFVTNE